MNPQRHILLTSCGLYPQVITEVIYALAKLTPAITINEVHVITTQVGLSNIQSQLLDESNGYFHKLCREYALHTTEFELENIGILKNTQGVFLHDIQSVSDNEVVADTVTNKVRELTNTPETTLHVSLAGGRRTLSYYLGYALSLFGRHQDRLYHVIVTQPYQADDEFFYPNMEPTFITDREGNSINTQDAKIHLADIPYVRLRGGLPKDLITGKRSFVEVVSMAAKYSEPTKIICNTNKRTLLVHQQTFLLPPVLYAWYTWILSRVRNMGSVEAAISVNTSPCSFINHIESHFGLTYSNLSRIRSALKSGFDIDYISEKNSLVNKKLEQVLGLGAGSYKIVTFGKRPHSQYTVHLDPENIVFE